MNECKSFVSDFHGAFPHHLCRLAEGEAGKQIGLKKHEKTWGLHGDLRTKNGVKCGLIRKGTHYCIWRKYLIIYYARSTCPKHTVASQESNLPWSMESTHPNPRHLANGSLAGGPQFGRLLSLSGEPTAECTPRWNSLRSRLQERERKKAPPAETLPGTEGWNWRKSAAMWSLVGGPFFLGDGELNSGKSWRWQVEGTDAGRAIPARAICTSALPKTTVGWTHGCYCDGMPTHKDPTPQMMVYTWNASLVL